MPKLFEINGLRCALPMFLPVFERGNDYVSMGELRELFGVQGIITNGFFLYKDREVRRQVLDEGVKSFYGFDGLVVTDSGAFQGFTRPLFLKNKSIIRFQQEIGADVVSPLDVVTTPGESKSVCGRKMEATLRRIAEGFPLMDRSVLVGVQQGGRFRDLRRFALQRLMEMGCRYVALGSLVPFFNKRHDLSLVGRIIREARAIVPEGVPIHLYGAGDPVELPFYAALGCDIFDSSSFVHYARKGWYMTPFGALRLGSSRHAEFSCVCPFCESSSGPDRMGEIALARHNLWTIVETVREIRRRLADGSLTTYLEMVLERHGVWFDDSLLVSTWRGLMADDE